MERRLPVGIGLAAVALFHALLHLVYVIAVFTLGQLLEGYVLSPWLVGTRIGLHPVAVIFSVMAGGQLFGMVGVRLGGEEGQVALGHVGNRSKWREDTS